MIRYLIAFVMIFGIGTATAQEREMKAAEEKPEETGLLLPAVQKVREAAAKSESGDTAEPAARTEEPGQKPQERPAVQKVRDAARQSDRAGDAPAKPERAVKAPEDDAEEAGLLLPAVQKVRSAAAKSEASRNKRWERDATRLSQGPGGDTRDWKCTTEQGGFKSCECTGVLECNQLLKSGECKGLDWWEDGDNPADGGCEGMRD